MKARNRAGTFLATRTQPKRKKLRAALTCQKAIEDALAERLRTAPHGSRKSGRPGDALNRTGGQCRCGIDVIADHRHQNLRGF